MKKTVSEYFREWGSQHSLEEVSDVVFNLSNISTKIYNKTISLNEILKLYQTQPNPQIIFILIMYFHSFNNQADVACKLYEEFKTRYGELTEVEIAFLNQTSSFIDINQDEDEDETD